MEQSFTALAQIKDLLRVHPEGLNIKNIASELNINRNTIAKHLEVLLFLGEVEVEQAGISHIFFLSRRIPVSSFTQLVNGSFLIIDMNFTIIDMNERFLELVRQTREELLEKKIQATPLNHFLGRKFFESMKEWLRSGTRGIPRDMIIPAGDLVVTCIPTIFDSGKTGIGLIFRQSIHEHDLKASGQVMSGIADLQEMVLRLHPDMTIIFANNVFTRNLRKSPEDLVGEEYAPLMPREDRNRITELLGTLTSAHPKDQVEHRAIMPDGSIRWQKWTFRALYSGNDELLEYQAVGLDITDAKSLEERFKVIERSLNEIVENRTEELRGINQQLYQEIQNMERFKKQAQFVQTSIDNATDPIVWVDENAQIFYANENAHVTLGYTRNELQSLKIQDIIPAYKAEYFNTIRGQAQNKASFIIDASMKSKNGYLIPAKVSISCNKYRNKGFYSLILRDITEWNAAEETRQRLIAIIEANPYLVGIMDPTLHLVYLNRAGRDLLNIGKEQDVSGFSLSTFLPEQSKEQTWNERISEATRDGAWRGESILKTLQGGKIPVEAMIIAHKTKNSATPTYLSMIALDITERKRAETALRESTGKYKTLFDASINGVFLTTEEGRILDCNTAACDIFQFNREDLIDSVVNKLLPEDAQGLLQSILHPVDPMKSDAFIESLGRRKNGQMFPVELTARRVDIGGVSSGMLFVHDITQRKREEQTLLAAAMYARRLVEANLDPMFMISPMGIITDVNRSAEELTGRSRAQLIRSEFRIHALDQDRADMLLKQILRDGMLRDEPLEMRHSGGMAKSISLSATVYRNESGEVQEIFTVARLRPSHV